MASARTRNPPSAAVRTDSRAPEEIASTGHSPTHAPATGAPDSSTTRPTSAPARFITCRRPSPIAETDRTRDAPGRYPGWSMITPNSEIPSAAASGLASTSKDPSSRARATTGATEG